MIRSPAARFHDVRGDHAGALRMPDWLRDLYVDRYDGRATDDELADGQRRAVNEVIRRQQEIGFEVVTEGELRRFAGFQQSFGGATSGFDALPYVPRRRTASRDTGQPAPSTGGTTGQQGPSAGGVRSQPAASAGGTTGQQGPSAGGVRSQPAASAGGTTGNRDPAQAAQVANRQRARAAPAGPPSHHHIASSPASADLGRQSTTDCPSRTG